MRVLAWGKNNLDKLDLEIVRTRMSELVFQFGKLDQSLANHPQATVKLIEEFLHEAYRYYQTEEMGHDYLIWLNDLTHDLRNYVEVSAKQCRLSLESINWLDNRALIWEELKRIKDSDIRSRFASQLVNSFLNSSTLSSEDVNQIVCARVIANFGENSSYSDDAWKVLVPDVEKSMKKSPRLFSRNLRTLFYDYTGFEISDLEKRNNNLVAKDGRFAIDLVQGKFCREGSLQNVFERTAKTFSENKAFFAKLNLYENSFYRRRDRGAFLSNHRCCSKSKSNYRPGTYNRGEALLYFR